MKWLLHLNGSLNEPLKNNPNVPGTQMKNCLSYQYNNKTFAYNSTSFPHYKNPLQSEK